MNVSIGLHHDFRHAVGISQVGVHQLHLGAIVLEGRRIEDLIISALEVLGAILRRTFRVSRDPLPVRLVVTPTLFVEDSRGHELNRVAGARVKEEEAKFGRPVQIQRQTVGQLLPVAVLANRLLGRRRNHRTHARLEGAMQFQTALGRTRTNAQTQAEF